jgi:hypothetical protein
LNFYNFNKSHESKIQAVGVDMGGGEITLGFRHDSAPDLQEQNDMATLVRACVGTGMMSPMLYKLKRNSKTPHTICTNFNPRTLAMVCSKYSCEGPKGKACKTPRLVKGDKDGKPVYIP